MYYTIDDFIKDISNLPAETIFVDGFNNPHSYRGSYDNLAVEPCDNTTAEEMLEIISNSIGKTFTEYKGGDFKMYGGEELFLAYCGCTGSRIEGVMIQKGQAKLVLNADYNF